MSVTAGTTRPRYVAESEAAVIEVRRHPIVLVRPFLAAIGAVVGALVIGSLVSWDDGGDFIDTMVGLTAIFFVLRVFWKILLWWEDRLVVTDQRIIEVSGVFTRKVASIPIEKVTDMTYRRSIWGRMLGYGDLILETAGQTQALDEIRFIPQPDHFYRTVTSLGTTQAAPSRVLLDEPAGGPDDDDTGPLPRIIL
ncbi:MAG: PH domain-containing protein [Actinomycetota bacterium]|nr:PH domain-containing protein [Actinomycetota bacterium]